MYIQKIERGRQARFNLVREKDAYERTVRDDRRLVRAELARMAERLRFELEALADYNPDALEVRASLLIDKWLLKHPDATYDDIISRMMQRFEKLLAHLVEVGKREGIPGLLYMAHGEQSNISDF